MKLGKLVKKRMPGQVQTQKKICPAAAKFRSGSSFSPGD